MFLLTILLACGSKASDDVTGEAAIESATEGTTTVVPTVDTTKSTVATTNAAATITTTNEAVSATNITSATSTKKEETLTDDESLKAKTSE